MDLKVLLPFIGYFLIIIGIGIYSSRFSSKGISEFFLGGRTMGRFVVALSAVVSGRSAWLLLGVSGMAYVQGLSAIWAVLGYTVIEFLLFVFYAPKLRKYTEDNDCITIPDFYASRFNDKNGALRILIVIIFLIFMVTYVAAQFASGGKAFFAHFGITQTQGLFLTAAIILVYTLMGGFMAVSYTDVAQGFMMILALLILPIMAIIGKGGWQQVSDIAMTPGSQFLQPFSLSALALIGYLGIGLGSPGNPHILIRYMSIRDSGQFKWTAVVGTIWNLFMGIGAVMIGVVGRAYFQEASALPGGDPENIFVAMANSVMHPFLVGLVLASVFAAIMSTADSQLLVAASSLVRDFYEKFLHKDKDIPSKKLSIYSRLAVSILVVLAVLLGLYSQDLIFWFVLFAWGGLGAAIGPTSILALFWKKTTKGGVIAGLLTGTFTVIIWKSVPALDRLMYELIPGFVLAFLVTVVVSIVENKKNNPTL